MLCETTNDPFINNAKHKWFYTEPKDYEVCYNYAQNIENPNLPIDNWKKALEIKHNLFGGINEYKNGGSCGILLFCRWFLLKCLKDTDCLNQYKHFIITRSDYYYDAYHPPISEFNDEFIWIPEGEDYNGITDRHIILPSKYVEQVLSLITPIFHDPDTFVKELSYCKQWNIEQLIWYNITK